MAHVVCYPSISIDPRAALSLQRIENFIDSRLTVLWIWVHIKFEIYYDYELFEISKLKNRGFDLICSYVSAYAISQYFDGFCSQTVLIGNGISESYLNITKSSHDFAGNWAFVSVFERGLIESVKAFIKVKEKCKECSRKFFFSSYYLPDKNSFDFLVNKLLASQIVAHSTLNSLYYTGSLSRLEISNLLSRTEYLVYPLVLPDGVLHLDTFATSILEAVAHGVIVIVWDVACFAEVSYSNRY